MKENDQIRYQVSDLLGVNIRPGGWEEAFRAANSDGRIDTNLIIRLLLLIFQKLDAIERAQASDEPVKQPESLPTQ